MLFEILRHFPKVPVWYDSQKSPLIPSADMVQRNHKFSYISWRDVDG